ncbi:hypothetical protein HK097_006751 [Rhizophlyctis rosea]|uniref:Uncharacterized protein n=1 Tax=Rhizophlyctis rosea TaxID=64517 RepID=A0AAD5X507_9FUNG|nr:hypothetical protein HK097_006751 [Rhizophlyctis rosea]
MEDCPRKNARDPLGPVGYRAKLLQRKEALIDEGSFHGTAGADGAPPSGLPIGPACSVSGTAPTVAPTGPAGVFPSSQQGESLAGASPTGPASNSQTSFQLLPGTLSPPGWDPSQLPYGFDPFHVDLDQVPPEVGQFLPPQQQQNAVQQAQTGAPPTVALQAGAPPTGALPTEIPPNGDPFTIGPTDGPASSLNGQAPPAVCLPTGFASTNGTAPNNASYTIGELAGTASLSAASARIVVSLGAGTPAAAAGCLHRKEDSSDWSRGSSVENALADIVDGVRQHQGVQNHSPECKCNGCRYVLSVEQKYISHRMLFLETAKRLAKHLPEDRRAVYLELVEKWIPEAKVPLPEPSLERTEDGRYQFIMQIFKNLSEDVFKFSKEVKNHAFLDQRSLKLIEDMEKKIDKVEEELLGMDGWVMLTRSTERCKKMILDISYGKKSPLNCRGPVGKLFKVFALKFKRRMIERMKTKRFAAELKAIIDGDQRLKEIMERLRLVEGSSPFEQWLLNSDNKDWKALPGEKWFALEVMKGQAKGKDGAYDSKKYDLNEDALYDTLEDLKDAWKAAQAEYLEYLHAKLDPNADLIIKLLNRGCLHYCHSVPVNMITGHILAKRTIDQIRTDGEMMLKLKMEELSGILPEPSRFVAGRRRGRHPGGPREVVYYLGYVKETELFPPPLPEECEQGDDKSEEIEQEEGEAEELEQKEPQAEEREQEKEGQAEEGEQKADQLKKREKKGQSNTTFTNTLNVNVKTVNAFLAEWMKVRAFDEKPKIDGDLWHQFKVVADAVVTNVMKAGKDANNVEELKAEAKRMDEQRVIDDQHRPVKKVNKKARIAEKKATNQRWQQYYEDFKRDYRQREADRKSRSTELVSAATCFFDGALASGVRAFVLNERLLPYKSAVLPRYVRNQQLRQAHAKQASAAKILRGTREGIILDPSAKPTTSTEKLVNEMRKEIICSAGIHSGSYTLEPPPDVGSEFLIKLISGFQGNSDKLHRNIMEQINLESIMACFVYMLVRTGGDPGKGNEMEPSSSDSRMSAKSIYMGRRWCIHAGVWGKSHPFPFITAETRQGTGSEVAFLFISTERQLRNVDKLFRTYDPSGGLIYTQMVFTSYMSGSPCAPFTTTTINFGWECGVHVDRGDYSRGYCTVAPVGEWRDGELWFPQFDCQLDMRPGDVCFFKSSLLWHGNLPLEGGSIRFPFVYFCDGKMVEEVAKTVNASTWRFWLGEKAEKKVGGEGDGKPAVNEVSVDKNAILGTGKITSKRPRKPATPAVRTPRLPPPRPSQPSPAPQSSQPPSLHQLFHRPLPKVDITHLSSSLQRELERGKLTNSLRDHRKIKEMGGGYIAKDRKTNLAKADEKLRADKKALRVYRKAHMATRLEPLHFKKRPKEPRERDGDSGSGEAGKRPRIGADPAMVDEPLRFKKRPKAPEGDGYGRGGSTEADSARSVEPFHSNKRAKYSHGGSNWPRD